MSLRILRHRLRQHGLELFDCGGDGDDCNVILKIFKNEDFNFLRKKIDIDI